MPAHTHTALKLHTYIYTLITYPGFSTPIQSDPALKPVNGVKQGLLPVKEKFDRVNDRVAALNRALARLQEEGPGYSVESIERPRKRSSEIKKRLSYVEHSYQRLTNDTYSTDSIRDTRNSVKLDTWRQ